MLWHSTSSSISCFQIAMRFSILLRYTNKIYSLQAKLLAACIYFLPNYNAAAADASNLHVVFTKQQNISKTRQRVTQWNQRAVKCTKGSARAGKAWRPVPRIVVDISCTQPIWWEQNDDDAFASNKLEARVKNTKGKTPVCCWYSGDEIIEHTHTPLCKRKTCATMNVYVNNVQLSLCSLHETAGSTSTADRKHYRSQRPQ